MSSKKTKVVIDTNLWISFLISKKREKLFELINSKKIILLFSEELWQEFYDTASNPKFEKYFTANELYDLIQVMNLFSELVIVKTKAHDCRDIKDNFLLSLSAEGFAQYLVTGDKDLLVLKTFGNTQIITLKTFESLF